MPELPEMENYKLLLNQYILGKTVTDVQINRVKSINVPPEDFIRKVKLHKITYIERRAKHLLFYLDNGNILLLHLMLGGWMYYGGAADKPKRTVQVQLSFGDHHLYFIGLRLGYLHIHDVKRTAEVLSELGPEPLSNEFTMEVFQTLIKMKHTKLKSVLLDQNFLSGIGNRYSDEICYEAKILPMRGLDQLEKDEVIMLYKSIKEVLKTAINNGGYMEHPFFKGDTLTGGYEALLNVHGREGEICKRCGSIIQMENISSRKTYYCKGCQI
ncbi:DNA-formamidopyrimidine glycosylase [Heyndrickxia camelliae]|uniref:Formamidopyrimidine-DNA glycosylase n=1 Tax=Heyndrickxia camelliae TaxID=1707093 RepID=A0A2N3LLR6_9BACI|nr:DNA-formamidopyrimidine glycosylase [Heyndrickxia camelliae]PKR85494.1 DNA-formamidopyrimidine glycosylase [Heyndrickxia camelliae]